MVSDICKESAAQYSADSCDFSTDIAIIGAGAAGLYASYCCGLSGLKFALFESLMIPGGQCSTIYPEKKMYGTPGFKDIKAKDFVDHLFSQASDYLDDSNSFFGYKVEKISKDGSLFVIEAKNQRSSENIVVSAKYLVITTGIGNMQPNVPPTISGIEKVNVTGSDFIQHYCMKMDLYANKDVIIAGGGDSAVDFTINIAPIANKVILIHRRNQFTCEQSKLAGLEKLKESGKLDVVLEHNISEVREGIEGRFVITKDKELNEHSFKTDYIVFCYGFLPNCKASIFGLEDLGLQKESNLVKVNYETMETDVEDCYAAGDIVTYPNKKKNIVPCFFEADRLVRSIKAKMFQG